MSGGRYVIFNNCGKSVLVLTYCLSAACALARVACQLANLPTHILTLFSAEIVFFVSFEFSKPLLTLNQNYAIFA